MEESQSRFQKGFRDPRLKKKIEDLVIEEELSGRFFERCKKRAVI
jgi:hypothetical protein